MSDVGQPGKKARTEGAVKDMSHGIIGTPVDPSLGAFTGAKS